MYNDAILITKAQTQTSRQRVDSMMTDPATTDVDVEFTPPLGDDGFDRWSSTRPVDQVDHVYDPV